LRLPGIDPLLKFNRLRARRRRLIGSLFELVGQPGVGVWEVMARWVKAVVVELWG